MQVLKQENKRLTRKHSGINGRLIETFSGRSHDQLVLSALEIHDDQNNQACRQASITFREKFQTFNKF